MTIGDIMTTSDMIGVMQAFERGEQIQQKEFASKVWLDVEKPTWDWSLFNYRVKPKDMRPQTWKEYCEQSDCCGKWWIDGDNNMFPYNSYHHLNAETDKTVCETKAEAEAFIALHQLRLLRKAWIGDWVPDWTKNSLKHCIGRYGDYPEVNGYKAEYYSLSFPTEEMAENFFNCFEELIVQAKDLL